MGLEVPLAPTDLPTHSRSEGYNDRYTPQIGSGEGVKG
jgi:hypothetical protein